MMQALSHLFGDIYLLNEPSHLNLQCDGHQSDRIPSVLSRLWPVYRASTSVPAKLLKHTYGSNQTGHGIIQNIIAIR